MYFAAFILLCRLFFRNHFNLILIAHWIKVCIKSVLDCMSDGGMRVGATLAGPLILEWKKLKDNDNFFHG